NISTQKPSEIDRLHLKIYMVMFISLGLVQSLLLPAQAWMGLLRGMLACVSRGRGRYRWW
ncbi:hypothetical protein RI534_00385, partial [Aeromonas allosaccharophila]|uniref:hypothetical protein n=1 Tax=Aeromonas allosaccharophila TaxID=656 RepID=UPI0034156E17